MSVVVADSWSIVAPIVLCFAIFRNAVLSVIHLTERERERERESRLLYLNCVLAVMFIFLSLP